MNNMFKLEMKRYAFFVKKGTDAQQIVEREIRFWCRVWDDENKLIEETTCKNDEYCVYVVECTNLAYARLKYAIKLRANMGKVDIANVKVAEIKEERP